MAAKVDSIKTIFKRALYSISFLIISTIYPLTNKYTGRERELTTFIDRLIPYNRYFILAYVFWYFYLAVFIAYFCVFDERKYYKLLIGINAGMIISYLIFLLFPTTVPRVDYVPSNDFIGTLFKLIYRRDNPYNCFPSIHVINTVLIAIYVHRDKMFIKWPVKLFNLISAVLIIYSTIAIRQHVFLDAVSGTAIAYMMYGILEHSDILKDIKGAQQVSET